ncbi:MAG: hypothetical protein H7Y30_02045 [Pyrinomonadaceae bacterium]|nr:hypothetical protein [Pyrinomonadaceae bacterium]
MSFQMSSSVSFTRGKLASSFGVMAPNSVSIGAGVSSSGVFFTFLLTMFVSSPVGSDECASSFCAGAVLRACASSASAARALRLSEASCAAVLAGAPGRSVTGSVLADAVPASGMLSIVSTPSSCRYKRCSLTSATRD